MAALGVNYIPANCCVICHAEKMNFAAGAMNPRGEQKGLCHKCYMRLRSGSVLDGFQKYVMPILREIKRGDYD